MELIFLAVIIVLVAAIAAMSVCAYVRLTRENRILRKLSANSQKEAYEALQEQVRLYRDLAGVNINTLDGPCCSTQDESLNMECLPIRQAKVEADHDEERHCDTDAAM